MRAAHTCIRRALIQAFRAPHQSSAAVSSVSDFLVPALSAPLRRPFSSPTPRPPPGLDRSPPKPSKTSKEPFPLHIPLPDLSVRDDIQEWLAALDPFLPPHLRQTPVSGGGKALAATPLDLAWVLNASQDAFKEFAQDLLGHMGVVEGRWAAVVWIVKKLVQDGPHMLGHDVELDTTWPTGRVQTLEGLTERPILLRRGQPSQLLVQTLDEKTAAPDTIDFRFAVMKRALGQVWRSLANMILAATREPQGKESTIMPHVLEIIAHLHHANLIPEPVYRERPFLNHDALQQPPTLHLLSSKILTALSDATWRAHEASVKNANHRFLGHEIPGSYYKVKVTELTPELWLELVLWSCVHGGWILDGASILQNVQSLSKYHGWSLISWRELLQAKERERAHDAASRTWRLLNRRDANLSTTPIDRALIHRTLSSEVVAALVDGLVNLVRIGIGARGADPEDLVNQLKNLKGLLEASSLSLGSATWDSIMVRLLESGGIVPEKRPELLRTIVDLASGFGAEVGSANTSYKTSGGDMEPPYFFEPSTASISILHRTMHSFLGVGDLTGALRTLQALQQHTDYNKQKSLEQFFKKLQTLPLQEAHSFDSPPIQFPAFELQIPIPLLARLLDLITETERYDLGRWLLFSKELDGPIIAEHMYHEWTMAASILRFGTLAGEHNLVLGVVERASKWNSQQSAKRLPADLMTALLRCQIQLQRWNTVGGMRDYVSQNLGYRPRPEVLAQFAASLLRLSNPHSLEAKERKVRAEEAFRDFLFVWERLLLTQVRRDLNSILGMLSSIHTSWAEFASQFLPTSFRHELTLTTSDFNIILNGVLDGYGSLKGKDAVDMWCYRFPKTFEAYRAAGGLPTMPSFRLTKSEELQARPEDIEITQPSGTTLTLRGRIHPNRQTVRAIVHKVRQEEMQGVDPGAHQANEKRLERRQTLKWAATLLYHMGLDHEDIIREFGSLAELADISETPSTRAPRYVQTSAPA